MLRAIQFRQLWEGRGWACRGAAARGKTIYGSTYPLPPDSDCALSVQRSTHRWELNSLTKTRPGVRAPSFCTSTANTNTCPPLTNSNFSSLENLHKIRSSLLTNSTYRFPHDMYSDYSYSVCFSPCKIGLRMETNKFMWKHHVKLSLYYNLNIWALILNS